jgi:hypothetical protein
MVLFLSPSRFSPEDIPEIPAVQEPAALTRPPVDGIIWP